jgi:hypothetical protein
MHKIFFSHKLVLILLTGLMLSVTGNAHAVERYRVSAQFYHLGELIGQPMMEVEEGETTAGTYSMKGQAQYKIVVLVRPVADGEVYVSLSFSSGKTSIQPNLMAEIGKPRSATIKKIRMNLLVEKVKADKLEIPVLAQQPDN